MKLVGPFWFAGSGKFGAQCLLAIRKVLPVEVVVTAIPRPAGRHLQARETVVELTAINAGLKVLRTNDVNRDVVILELLKEKPPAAFFVVDFAQKIAEPFLSAPSLGCLNIHPSLLPLYRGAAPLQRAIMNGESKTGVTVFRLVHEMDAGPVLLSSEFPINADETYGDLSEKLSEEGSRLLVEGLELLQKGRISFKEQCHEKASFAPRISRQESELSWEKPSKMVHDLVRAMNPLPGSFFYYEGKRVKVWKTSLTSDSGPPSTLTGFLEGNPVVACGDFSVSLIEVQQEGRKRTGGAEWIRGSSLKKGEMIR